MSRVRGNRVCFTLNNPDEEEHDGIVRFLDDAQIAGKLQFAIIGEEVAPETGTIHLQGFVHLNGGSSTGRGRGVKFWKNTPGLQRAHFESARGSDKDSEAYCSKEGIYRVWGEPKATAGDVFQEVYDLIQSEDTLAGVAEQHPEIAIKHWTGLAGLWGIRASTYVVPKILELRAWQVCWVWPKDCIKALALVTRFAYSRSLRSLENGEVGYYAGSGAFLELRLRRKMVTGSLYVTGSVPFYA